MHLEVSREDAQIETDLLEFHVHHPGLVPGKLPFEQVSGLRFIEVPPIPVPAHHLTVVRTNPLAMHATDD